MSNTALVNKGIELGIIDSFEDNKISLKSDFDKNKLEEFLNFAIDKDMKAIKVLSHIFPENSGRYFICGEGGNKDQNGLPDSISVCPAYGASFSIFYDKRKVSSKF